MTKDYPTAAGALYSRLAIETGVEASVIMCGHFLGAIQAQLRVKQSKIARKIELQGKEAMTPELAYDLRILNEDCKKMEALSSTWEQIRRYMDPRPGSKQYLETSAGVRKLAEQAYEIGIRQEVVDLPDASRFGGYKLEGDRR